MKKSRILSLQALRALAFICIFISHAYSRLTNIGAFGVSIFIMLSGFCMMYSYKDKKTPIKLQDRILFSINKIKKLYPLHIISLVTSLVFIIIRSGMSYTLLTYLVLDMLLVQSWVPSAAFSINGVAWYLSLCLFLYFMFPWIKNQIIAQKKDKKNLIWAAVGIFIVQLWVGYMSSLLVQGGVDVKWATYIWPIFRLGDFTIGCIMGYLFSIAKRPKTRKQQLIKNTALEMVVILVILGIQFLLLKEITPFNEIWLKYNLIYTPISAVVIWIFTTNEGLFIKILTNKTLIRIGNVSGYAFLIHVIVLYRITSPLLNALSIESPKKIQVLVAFMLTIFLSSSYIKIDTFIREKIETWRGKHSSKRKSPKKTH